MRAPARRFVCRLTIVATPAIAASAALNGCTLRRGFFIRLVKLIGTGRTAARLRDLHTGSEHHHVQVTERLKG